MSLTAYDPFYQLSWSFRCSAGRSSLHSRWRTPGTFHQNHPNHAIKPSVHHNIVAFSRSKAKPSISQVHAVSPADPVSLLLLQPCSAKSSPLSPCCCPWQHWLKIQLGKRSITRLVRTPVELAGRVCSAVAAVAVADCILQMLLLLWLLATYYSLGKPNSPSVCCCRLHIWLQRGRWALPHASC